MSNVVRFPTIFLAVGSLMVGARAPLRLLHAAASSLGVPRDQFYRAQSRAGSLPRYSLTPAQIRRAELRFGPSARTEEEEAAAVDACFRPRRPNLDQAAAR